MNILLLNGSHRKGNTQFMLQSINAEIHNLDSTHKTTLINLRQKDIQFCQQQDYNCTVTSECANCCRDDMKELYPLIEQADVFVLGSPVYFSNVSARMKNFMDRCNPLYFSGGLKGKLLVMVGVGESQNTKEFFESLKIFGQTMGMKVIDAFYTRGESLDTVEKDHQAVDKLKEFTKLFLVSSSKTLKSVVCEK